MAKSAPVTVCWEGLLGAPPETWCFWSEVWLHSALGSLKKQTDTILLLLKPWKRCEQKNQGMSLPNFKITRLIAIIAGKKVGNRHKPTIYIHLSMTGDGFCTHKAMVTWGWWRPPGFSQGCIVSHLVAAILRQRGAIHRIERVPIGTLVLFFWGAR